MTGPAPPRRCWRSRKVLYAGLVLCLFGGAYLLHGWLFVPEDLRRMQGSWKTVEFELEGRKTSDIRLERFTFIGNRLKTSELFGGDSWIELEPSSRKFRVYLERATLGTKLRALLSRSRPAPFSYGEYEIDGDELVLWFRGLSDTPEFLCNKYILNRE